MDEYNIRFHGGSVPATAAGGAGQGGGTVPPDPALDRSTLGRLGEQLRAMYDEGAREPIPVDWLELLHRIDDPER